MHLLRVCFYSMHDSWHLTMLRFYNNKLRFHWFYTLRICWKKVCAFILFFCAFITRPFDLVVVHEQVVQQIHNKSKQAMVDTRLCPFVRDSRWVLPVFVVEQNLAGISAVISLLLVVFYRRWGIHTTRHGATMWKHGVIHKTGST